MSKVTVEYLGHSCFRLNYQGQRIVLDPYADGSVPGLAPLRAAAEFVYCSHDHADHNAVRCVRLTNPAPEPAFQVREYLTDHDDAGGAKRGRNTVRVFTFGTLRVAHFGDLGRPLTAAETEALSGLDMVLMPVGGFYTIDAATAKEILRKIAPRVTVPMHFRTDDADYDVLAHIDDVARLLGEITPGEDSFTLTEETPRQTLLMKVKTARDF